MSEIPNVFLVVPLAPPPPPVVSSSSIHKSTTSSHSPTPTKTEAKPLQALQASPSPVSGGSGSDFFGHSLGSSGLNGITYSPYSGSSQASSSCKGADEIADDIRKIHNKGFNRVRLYATDCNQLSVVGPVASKLGMQIIIGIFVNSPSSADSDFAKQLQAIKDYISVNGAGNIDALLVGNEPFSGQHATVDQIASYLSQAKAAFPNLKVSCPMTHGELIQYGGQLCGLLDVVAAQIHPFFSSSYVSPAASGAYVESEMSLMSAICGNKPVFVSECGYPSGGGTWLSQIAGIFEQESAISSIRGSAKANHITIFSSSSDDWKMGPGVQMYETKFNCLNLF